MREGGRRRARPAGGARSRVCIPASCPPMRAPACAGCCADRHRARADGWRTCAEAHAGSARRAPLRRAHAGPPAGRRSAPAAVRGRSRRCGRSSRSPSPGRPSSRYRRRAPAAAPPSGTIRSLPPFPVTRTVASSAFTSPVRSPHASAARSPQPYRSSIIARSRSRRGSGATGPSSSRSISLGCYAERSGWPVASSPRAESGKLNLDTHILVFALLSAVACLKYATMNNAAKTRFGKTGLEVSQLGFGEAPIGFLKADRQSVSRILNLLLDSGVNLIDTAAAYARSEELIAEAVGAGRGEYVIVSKCGRKAGELKGDLVPGLITASVERSLKNLRTDTLDVMLLHSCDRQVLEQAEASRGAGQGQGGGENPLRRLLRRQPSRRLGRTATRHRRHRNLHQHRRPGQHRHRTPPSPHSTTSASSPNAPSPTPPGEAPTPLRHLHSIRQTLHRTLPTTPPHTSQQLGFNNDNRLARNRPPLHPLPTRPPHRHHRHHQPPKRRRDLAYVANGPLPATTVEKIRESFNKAETASGTKWIGQT